MLPSPTRASKTSRKAILASEKLQDYGMSKAIERALLQVFKNPSYLPHDPYKTLLQSLRQSEVGQDLNMPRVVAYTEMAPEGSVPETCSEFTTAKLAAFGDSKGIGLRHLAKLVSLSAINRVYSVMVALKEALGSLPREAKTRGIEATFMEAVPVCMCMSDALSRPVTHRLEVTVEALIKNVSDKSQASFDDCLMLFIRRVVEEAYLADRCADIVTDHIQVVMGVSGRHVQVIPLKTMRSRRQQVLSILKVRHAEIPRWLAVRLTLLLSSSSVPSPTTPPAPPLAAAAAGGSGGRRRDLLGHVPHAAPQPARLRARGADRAQLRLCPRDAQVRARPLHMLARTPLL